jgi:hypothetical protein
MDAETEVQARVARLKALGVDELADRILDPQPVTITFLGETLKLVPLPALLAKRVRKQVGAFYSKAPKAEEVTENATLLADYEMSMGDLFIEVVQVVLEHYGFKKSLSDIEAAPIATTMAFLEEQLEVNGEQDFFLRPLRRLLSIYGSSPRSVVESPPSPTS